MPIIKKPKLPTPQALSDADFNAFVSKAPDVLEPAAKPKTKMRGKQVQFTIQMPPGLFDELNAYTECNYMGLSRNQIIAAAVKTYLAAQTR